MRGMKGAEKDFIGGQGREGLSRDRKAGLKERESSLMRSRCAVWLRRPWRHETAFSGAVVYPIGNRERWKTLIR